MSDLTDFAENKAAANLLGTGTYYIALHSADPGEAGAANELAAASGYARQPDTFTVTGDTAANDSAISFGPATADQGTVTHFSIWDAATAGNCICKAALTVSRAWPSGNLEAAAGDFALTLA